VFTACFLAAACGGSPKTSPGGGGRYATNGTFTLLLSEDLGGFDPYRGSIFSTSSLAYDSLVNLRSDGAFVSGLAGKWTADARRATFTLRRNVTCSDGTPLTAGQVAEDLKYLGDPKNKSPQYGVNTPPEPFTVTGDEGAGTVTVTMDKEPFGFLLNTIGLAPIMCAKGLKNPTLLQKASDGTGPFVLTKVVPGQSYTFTVRRDYRWGPGGAATTAPGTPTEVGLRVVTNETTAANLLLSGEANMALVAGPDRARLDARGLKRLEVSATGTGLRFNQRDSRPAAEERVRRALVQALDLGEIVKVSTGGVGTAATGLVLTEPRACAGDTVTGLLPRYDVAGAESLLDAAGWTKGPGDVRAKNGKPLSIDLHYLPSVSIQSKPTAELIAEKWKTIGVTVKLTADTPVTNTEALFKTGNWDVQTNTGNAYLPSAWVPYQSGPLPPKGTNLGGINKQYDELVAKAKTLTESAACTYWNQADEALYKRLDIVPISNRPRLYYLNKADGRTAGYQQPIPTSIRLLR
jgi:peptide/nickel transport system substrate-binding protein